MATSSEKNGKHTSNGTHAHSGFASHPAHSASSGRSSKRARAQSSTATQAKLEQVINLARDLPHTLQTELRSNPMRVIATVGAGAFVMGALLGSRMGRLAIAAALPHVVERVFQGALGDKIRSLAEEVTENMGIEADA
jgi:hypothetical protein